ncbi:hypothetical protein [Bacillus wiedmannii]|uniref:hypothetical protein n=1 Tax=Bacillus wiedmannii TaxID=1890302 RepID=UPI00211D5DCE|nr:hypothetical protein [Bacillus wiedmannii]
MPNNNIWLDEIIEILTEVDGTGTLNQIKIKVVERNNIDLDCYLYEQSIAKKLERLTTSIPVM